MKAWPSTLSSDWKLYCGQKSQPDDPPWWLSKTLFVSCAHTCLLALHKGETALLSIFWTQSPLWNWLHETDYNHCFVDLASLLDILLHKSVLCHKSLNPCRCCSFLHEWARHAKAQKSEDQSRQLLLWHEPRRRLLVSLKTTTTLHQHEA